MLSSFSDRARCKTKVRKPPSAAAERLREGPHRQFSRTGRNRPDPLCRRGRPAAEYPLTEAGGESGASTSPTQVSETPPIPAAQRPPVLRGITGMVARMAPTDRRGGPVSGRPRHAPTGRRCPHAGRRPGKFKCRGFACCLFGDAVQAVGVKTLDPVTGNRWAVSPAALRDPLRQGGGPCMKSADGQCRRSRKHVGIAADRLISVRVPGNDQEPGPGLAMPGPDGREVMCLEVVVARVVVRGRTQGADLLQIDIRGWDSRRVRPGCRPHSPLSTCRLRWRRRARALGPGRRSGRHRRALPAGPRQDRSAGLPGWRVAIRRPARGLSGPPRKR